MKKTHICIISLALSLSMPLFADAKQKLHQEKDLKSILLDGKKPDRLKKTTPESNTRSAEEPQTSFRANEAKFEYYGDLSYLNGNAGYWLYLSNADMDETGMPTKEGQIAAMFLIAPPAIDENMELPTGTFVISNSYKVNTIDPTYSFVWDIFYDPEDPASGDLYFYGYDVVEGEAVITKTDDIYTINLEFYAELYNSAGQLLDGQDSYVTYTGPVEQFEEVDPYPPLDHDVEMVLTNLSGMYTDGDFSLTFYSVPLDAEGYILGEGDLFNTELFVEELDYLDPENVLGVFEKTCDPFVEGQVPDTFMEGMYYEIFSGYIIPLGTYYNHYDKDANVDASGLASEGKITVTMVGDEHKFDIEVYTPDGYKMTGSWQGKLKDYVVDSGSGEGPSNSIKDINVGNIYEGNIPEGAEIYTIGGVRTNSNSLTPGLYIVKYNGEAKKVMIK